MGCDIHIVLERRKKAGCEWTGVYLTDVLPGGLPKIAQRDYHFFALVAAVRGSVEGTSYPKNLPEDVSALAWEAYMQAPTDYHSPSHMDVGQFVAAWVKSNENNLNGVRPEWALTDLLGIWSDDEKFDHRVVFWFDN